MLPRGRGLCILVLDLGRLLGRVLEVLRDQIVYQLVDLRIWVLLELVQEVEASELLKHQLELLLLGEIEGCVELEYRVEAHHYLPHHVIVGDAGAGLDE